MAAVTLGVLDKGRTEDLCIFLRRITAFVIAPPPGTPGSTRACEYRNKSTCMLPANTGNAMTATHESVTAHVWLRGTKEPDVTRVVVSPPPHIVIHVVHSL